MLRAALFLLSLAGVLYEIALVRLASVLLRASVTYLVVAGCLATLGLGAALAARLASPVLPARAALFTCLAGIVALVACVHTPLGFGLGLFALPYLGIGAFAGAVYAASERSRLAYAADVLGGALGAVMASPLLRAVGDVDLALFALCAASASLGLVAAGRLRIAAVAAPLLLVANLWGGVLAVDPYASFGFTPHLVLQTRDRGGRVVETAWDGFARTDLVVTDEPGFRYMFTDRMFTARIARWDGRSASFEDPGAVELSRLKGLAFRALRPRRVLVLGAGGGFDVALALQSGAAHVDAVEVNPAMLRMTRALGAFAGRVYLRPEVAVHHAEARRFVRQSQGPWDAISLSLMQTEPAVDRGHTGIQSWVFTAEAVAAYLGRLAPGGVVVIVQNTRGVADRTLATVRAGLARLGLPADGRVATLSLPEGTDNPFAWLVAAGREPLSPEARDALRREAVAAGALPVDLQPRFAPATDERPFFYDFDGAQPIVHVLAGAGAAALLFALFASDRLSAAPRLQLRGWACAGLLGAGFLLAQSALMSRAQFLIGYPAPAVAAVLGGMLVAGGTASLIVGDRGTLRQRLAIGSLLVAGSAIAITLAWPFLRDSAPTSTFGLVALAAGLAAVLAAPSGVAFPAAIQWHGRGEGRALFYGANALAGIMGAALAGTLLPSLGLGWMLVAAAACYAGAAATAIVPARGRVDQVAPGLRRHVPADALEGAHLARILAFIERHPTPFDRRISEGHLTGSAVVVSASGDQVLLLHHRKLDLWLQPGGHGELGETSGESVALREALEETGIQGLALHPAAPRPLDVDIHDIPARGDEPAHQHLDLRYLVVAPPGAEAQRNAEESHALRWCAWHELGALGLDPGLERALAKVRRILGR